MNLTDQRKAVQTALGSFYTGPIDGQLGANSRQAFEALATAQPDQSLGNSPSLNLVEGLQPNTWPQEQDAASYFGYPPNLTQLEVPYPLHLFGPNGSFVGSVTCNIKVAASLRRIFAAILAHYGSTEAIHAVGLDVFDGIYNDRNVRGSSSKRSMHAYGAAIDLDAEHNTLGATSGRMPRDVVNIFKAESWRWGGDYTGRKDWMHFEACR